MNTRSKILNISVYRALSELRSEGARTYAGYLWWILAPLMSLAVYYVAFKYILNRGTENFAVFLFSGIVVYRFFANTVTRGSESILGGKGLMQLVYLHKSIFPLTVVLVNLFKFIITLLLLMVACWAFGLRPAWAYLSLPLLLVSTTLLVAGAAMFCAAIMPFIPDFKMILSTIVHLLIFLSGVFFDVSRLSAKMQMIIRWNPLATLIEQFRLVLLHGRWPNLAHLAQATLTSMIMLVIGWLLIQHFDRRYAKIS
ncbi:MAG: ABC transporter permease [Phycisphaerales bacterium]|jgi:lipopolysaccharide transport system permease protein|nr:ABC transporter permease [Phycisphaerales bacterium]